MRFPPPISRTILSFKFQQTKSPTLIKVISLHFILLHQELMIRTYDMMHAPNASWNRCSNLTHTSNTICLIQRLPKKKKP